MLCATSWFLLYISSNGFRCTHLRCFIINNTNQLRIAQRKSFMWLFYTPYTQYVPRTISLNNLEVNGTEKKLDRNICSKFHVDTTVYIHIWVLRWLSNRLKIIPIFPPPDISRKWGELASFQYFYTFPRNVTLYIYI